MLSPMHRLPDLSGSLKHLLLLVPNYILLILWKQLLSWMKIMRLMSIFLLDEYSPVELSQW